MKPALNAHKEKRETGHISLGTVLQLLNTRRVDADTVLIRGVSVF